MPRNQTETQVEKKHFMKRLHVHVAVVDLAANIRFHSTAFGMPPTVEKPGYAKWMIEILASTFLYRLGFAAALSRSEGEKLRTCPIAIGGACMPG